MSNTNSNNLTIFFVSLGCDKNLVDSEVMLGILRTHGFTLVDDEIEADIIVVNTCSFIHDAKEESIQTILEMAEMKHSCRCKALIVTGCMAERYKDDPNIIWFIGGDIRGDVKTAEWEALATSIKAIDKNHLMTFHPRGRTTSATWFNNAPWLDFNMFQSGHRRYGQRFGDGDYPIEENTEEDNWRFVERSMAMKPMKPVIDGEPIYEEIPHGLHDENELLWKDYDVRRYAYWSVFAGSFGHTYGHNSIMQFIKPGVGGAYGAKKPWYDALNDPGYNQMKYLKNLMLTFPFFERVPDQSVIAGQNGERYDRAIATRGNDYLMVYNYTGRPMEVDFSKISGAKKNAWWYTTKDGKLEYIGEFDNGVHKFQHDSGYSSGNDHILIVVDSSKDYVKKDCYQIDTHE